MARIALLSAWRPLAAALPQCDGLIATPAMEPQEEAHTLGASVPRPPGASVSPTLDEEERPEGSAAPVAAPAGEEGDGAGVDGLWELPVERAERRPECSRCR